jgi:Asp-tRNA(Asn)/Glu-tRNA(Gln) amidotransferase A subunit family amidase
MGMLFTAGLGEEATLFRLAAQLEQAMPWRERIAPHAVS